MRRTYVVCPVDNRPVGRHQETLRPGSTCSTLAVFPPRSCITCPASAAPWFENKTPVCQFSQITFEPDDLVVLPETLGPRAADMSPGARSSIFNQNCYYTFLDYPADPGEIPTPYAMHDVLGVMAVSDDSQQYLRHAFPEIRLFRYHYGIDPGLFSPGFPKKKQRVQRVHRAFHRED